MYPEKFDFAPSVFAVGENYLVCVSCSSCEATVCVRVGEKMFYDASNGILRSKKYLHMVEIPMEVLEKAGEYTIILREFTERKPYFPTSLEPVEYTVKFRTVSDKDEINICYIADTHGHVNEPVQASKNAGITPDLLVLGGDIADHSGDIENFKTLFEIAGGASGGEYPCIFSRGNHDLRGHYAELLGDYTPTDGGRSYYSVKLGKLWALVLDCGEDKDDDCIEYGYTVACHDFRLRETEFIKNVTENAENEFEGENVKYKLVLSHVPFAIRYKDPFNPEEEIYTQWCRLLSDSIKPDLWLAGHKHICEVSHIGSDWDDFGQPCTCIIGSKPELCENEYKFNCTFVKLSPEGNSAFFADNLGNRTEAVNV